MESNLSKLLAAIHGDDGQYESTFGTKQAIEMAITIVANANLSHLNGPTEVIAVYTEDDVRHNLTKKMEEAGGLVKWANANDIPISRVSEFNTGRRSASQTILVALGFYRAIVRLTSVRPVN